MKVSQRVRSHVLRLLFSVFRDHEVIQRWVSIYPDLHFLLSDCTASLKYFEAVQRWCQDEIAVTALDTSDRDWVLSARESAATFFNPLATSIAIMSFHEYDSELKDEDLCKRIDFLNAYTNMVSFPFNSLVRVSWRHDPSRLVSRIGPELCRMGVSA